MRQPLTLAVCFRNEARRLPHLLASVAGVVSEVVYGNNASEDASEEIVQAWCQEQGIPAVGFVEPKVCGYPEPFFQRCFDLATQQWTLLCGADEVVTPEGRAFLSALSENTSDACYVRWGSAILGSYDGTRPQEMMLFFEHQLRLWRTGSIHQPPLLHTQAEPLPGKTVGQYGNSRPFIQQVKSGWEQLRRDKARSQYPEIDLPPSDPYLDKSWAEMFSC